MCEFCTKHGEGKKWYLQMKNYSNELRSAQLTPAQRKATGFTTRSEWLDAFFQGFVQSSEKPKTGEAPRPQREERRPSNAAITRKAMIVHFGQVLPLKDVEEVLDLMTSITRVPCGCRYITTGKADKRYCFGLGYDPHGIMGRYPDNSSSLEVLERSEAKRIIRQLDGEGLIHSIWTGVTPFVIGLCNCDHDCLAYRTSIAQDGPASFFRAEYVAEVDIDRCTGCKSCMKQCQFGAQFYSHSLDRVYIDPMRCYGCGVCMAACAKDAIKLVSRREHPQARAVWLKKPSS
jgi:NAD-dependent dihydropyrimidine dehydrogenase PreA subunit